MKDNRWQELAAFTPNRWGASDSLFLVFASCVGVQHWCMSVYELPIMLRA